MNEPQLRTALKDLLDQTHDLLNVIDDKTYIHQDPLVMNATIGGHVRHVLEHIEPILDTPEEGVLDYDARPRDREVETSRVAARRRVEQLSERLDAHPSEWETHRLRIRNRVATGGGEAPVVPSFRARELMYAVGHTLHHYAIIRVICNLQKIEVAKEFGFAPSTLHHRKTAENG
ncbi:MAG: hypothetical protein PF795_01205 [Kiritimatiellae bacterium]|nr:hypothetical protein [Kiritimatiellia bacterium]